MHVLLDLGGKLCLGLFMFSFRLLPPLHFLPRWTRFLIPVFLPGGILGLTFRDSPAFSFLFLPRFRCGLFLLRLRFFLGAVHGPVGDSVFPFGSGTGDRNFVPFSSTFDFPPGEWL